MKEIFFNEDGALIINQTIMSQPTFQKIMEDGKVTEDELVEQGRVVLGLFREVEDTFSEIQKRIVERLIVESNVLNTIYKYYEMNNIQNGED